MNKEQNINLYKCRGSVVAWSLNNNIEDAFIIWLLSQKRDREYHYKKGQGADGLITDPIFLKYLAKSMDVSRETAGKRLERAVQYGFLNILDKENHYSITSNRKLVKVAMSMQKLQCDKDKSIISPFSFLKNDLQFTRKFENWIDPKDLQKTRALMYTAVSIQRSPLLSSRETHAKILDCHKRTLQKYARVVQLEEFENYLTFDVYKILIDPTTRRYDTIQAFKEAESLYCKLGYTQPGKQFLFTKTFKNTLYLTIQLPNTYQSTLDEKIVPARAGLVELKSVSGVPVRKDDLARVFTPKKANLFTGSISSRDGAHGIIPDSIYGYYIRKFENIMEVDECRERVLRLTGSSGMRSVKAADPRLWRQSSSVSSTIPSKITESPIRLAS